MERGTGIEPVAQAWEAWVLPLYEPRLISILARHANLSTVRFIRESQSITEAVWSCLIDGRDATTACRDMRYGKYI
jgi:hypothetical protein